VYRFRILNAANARTLLLAFRTAAGTPIPFTLIGNDGGLLPAPIQCTQAFIATAERIDVLVDLGQAAVGETVLLHTLAFDAMHAEGAKSAPADSAAMAHAMPGSPAEQDHAHAGTWPEGAPRPLLELRVRKRMTYDRRIPDSLSAIARIDTANAHERPLRLGFAKGRWRINDRVFEMGVTPIEVVRGTVETGCCATITQACRTRCICTGSPSSFGARNSPDAVAALAVDAQGACPPISDARIRCWYGLASPCASPSTSRIRSWAADLHVPLPQPGARGRRDDAGRGRNMRIRPLRRA
jgi:suppressor of ftsI/bilirubin oxidase